MVRGGLLYINAARFRPRGLGENWKFEGAIDAMCVTESLTIMAMSALRIDSHRYSQSRSDYSLARTTQIDVWAIAL